MKTKIVWGLVAAMACLAGCGGGDRRVDPTPHLLVFLKSENPDERINAAEEFAALEELPPQAIPGLIAALQDEDERVRLQVVKVLGGQQERAEKLVPELYKLQEREKVASVQAAIGQALKDLDAENVHVRKP